MRDPERPEGRPSDCPEGGLLELLPGILFLILLGGYALGALILSIV